MGGGAGRGFAAAILVFIFGVAVVVAAYFVFHAAFAGLVVVSFGLCFFVGAVFALIFAQIRVFSGFFVAAFVAMAEL